MKRLSLETVVAMHSELIAQTGGLDGVRDVILALIPEVLLHVFGYSLLICHTS